MTVIRADEASYPTWLFLLLLASLALAVVGAAGIFIRPGLLTSGLGAIGFTILWFVIERAERIYERALKVTT